MAVTGPGSASGRCRLADRRWAAPGPRAPDAAQTDPGHLPDRGGDPGGTFARSEPPSDNAFIAVGAASGLGSALLGPGGPLTAPFFLAEGLHAGRVHRHRGAPARCVMHAPQDRRLRRGRSARPGGCPCSVHRDDPGQPARGLGWARGPQTGSANGPRALWSSGSAGARRGAGARGPRRHRHHRSAGHPARYAVSWRQVRRAVRRAGAGWPAGVGSRPRCRGVRPR